MPPDPSSRPRRQAARQEPAASLAERNKVRRQALQDRSGTRVYVQSDHRQATPEDVRLTARSIVRNGERVTVITPTVARAMAQQEAGLRQAQELIDRQQELQAAQARGDEIVITELGATVSVDVGNVRPASWPEGGPVLRAGRWV